MNLNEYEQWLDQLDADNERIRRQNRRLSFIATAASVGGMFVLAVLAALIAMIFG